MNLKKKMYIRHVFGQSLSRWTMAKNTAHIVGENQNRHKKVPDNQVQHHILLTEVTVLRISMKYGTVFTC